MRQVILILTALASLTLAHQVQAAIGWNLKKCEQAFGTPIVGPKAALATRTRYESEVRNYYVNAFFINGKVSRISFHKKSGYLDKTTVPELLALGGPKPGWGYPWKDMDNTWHWVNLTRDLFASATDNWTTVVLWTKADREAIGLALK